MNPNALVEIRSFRVILLNPNACPTLPQPHSALTGPTRLFQSNFAAGGRFTGRGFIVAATTTRRRRGGDDATTTRRRRRVPSVAAAPDALTVAAALPRSLTGPTRPFSAPLGPNRPHASGLVFAFLQPHSALAGPTRLGPTRPEPAPLGLSL